MTDAELVALAIARVGSTARLADLMWIEPRNLRRYASGEKPLSPVKRAKLEALVAEAEKAERPFALEGRDILSRATVRDLLSRGAPLDGVGPFYGEPRLGEVSVREGTWMAMAGHRTVSIDGQVYGIAGVRGVVGCFDLEPFTVTLEPEWRAQSSSVSALNGPEGGINGGGTEGETGGSGSGGANVSV